MKRSVSMGFAVVCVLAGAMFTVSPAQAVVWNTETVDTVGNVGHCSLALDASGLPHVAYYHEGVGLKYAAHDGSSWSVQTVESGYMGTYASLALDAAGNPHISYVDASGTYDNLRYAHYNGTSWSKQTIDTGDRTGRYNDIALDSLGRPHISYFDGWYGPFQKFCNMSVK